jgi:hypothetical protein
MRMVVGALSIIGHITSGKVVNIMRVKEIKTLRQTEKRNKETGDIVIPSSSVLCHTKVRSKPTLNAGDTRDDAPDFMVLQGCPRHAAIKQSIHLH